jgi:hypothetical protein
VLSPRQTRDPKVKSSPQHVTRSNWIISGSEHRAWDVVAARFDCEIKGCGESVCAHNALRIFRPLMRCGPHSTSFFHRVYARNYSAYMHTWPMRLYQNIILFVTLLVPGCPLFGTASVPLQSVIRINPSGNQTDRAYLHNVSFAPFFLFYIPACDKAQTFFAFGPLRCCRTQNSSTQLIKKLYNCKI